MAARSYLIQITNLTERTLELDREKSGLQDGTWHPDAPPDVVKNGQTIQFGSESRDPSTGTEGRVVYTCRVGDFTIYWDNPFIGADETSVQTPEDFASNKEDSKGDNATLKIVFYPAPDGA